MENACEGSMEVEVGVAAAAVKALREADSADALCRACMVVADLAKQQRDVLALLQAGAPAALVETVVAHRRSGPVAAACRAIAAIARHCPTQSHAAFLNAGAHAALVAVVRRGAEGRFRRPRQVSVMKHAFRAIAQLGGKGSCAVFLEAGASVALVAALRQAVRGHCLDVLVQACRAFDMLACGNAETAGARRLALVQAGAPAALVSAVHEAVRVGNAGALEQVCDTAVTFSTSRGCYRGAGIKAPLVRAGAPAALIAAASAAAGSRHKSALRNACRALEYLEQNASAALAAAARDAVRAGNAGAMEQACWAIVEFADDDDYEDDERKDALVQAGAPAALVAAAHEAVRMRHAGVLKQACEALRSLHGFLDNAEQHALTDLANLAVGDAASQAVLVQAGLHEFILGISDGLRLREGLFALAGPDATWTAMLGPEPLERVMYRIRIARASFGVPEWAERHSRDLSDLAKQFKGNQAMLAIIARSCVLAHGNELAPNEGWKQDWRVFQDRLLESAERAVLMALYIL